MALEAFLSAFQAAIHCPSHSFSKIAHQEAACAKQFLFRSILYFSIAY